MLTTIALQENALDTINFDPEFTNEIPVDTPMNSSELSQSAQDQFSGWSYNRPLIPGMSDGMGSVRDPNALGNGSVVG